MTDSLEGLPSELRKAAEMAWEIHIKDCSCKAIGKWNKKGGTTENYHAFIYGYMASAGLAAKDRQKLKEKVLSAIKEVTKVDTEEDNCNHSYQVAEIEEKVEEAFRK